MTYTLVALFLLTGDPYIEREMLTLHGCPGYAAIERAKALEIADRIGPVRYLCLPGWKARHMVMDDLTRRLTERR